MIRSGIVGLLALAMIMGVAVTARSQEAVTTAKAVAEPESEQPGPIQHTESRRILVMLEQAPNRLRPGTSYASGYGTAQTRAARERLGRTIASQYGFEFVELWPMPLLGLDCLIFEVADRQTVAEAVRIVEQHPAVKWAEPMEVYEALAQGGRSDPLAALSPAAMKWDLARVHASWTGRKVRVAVIDTQVDLRHPDLLGRIKVSRNFAPQSPARPEFHGTEVAGIIAANAGNGIGIAGVAPEAELLALRACWQRDQSSSSLCTSLNLARALNYAIESKANIINLSLGGPPNRLLSELIETATQRGIAVVAAYDAERPAGGFPASHPGVISAARRGTSSGNAYVAPGTDIPTTKPGGGFHFVTGSSYSAAHISGLLALRYERSRSRRGPWQSIVLKDSSTREIDIRTSFN